MNYFHIQQCSKACAKGMLIGLNVMCIITAVCTLGFSIVDIRILKQYGADQANGTFVGDLIIILACLLLVAVAIFGCLGAARDNIKILYLYVGMLMMMELLELLLAIYVSVQRYGLEFRIMNWLRDDFYKNDTIIVDENGVSLHRRTWDDLQSTYECCGLNGPDDYLALNEPISISCCPRALRARTAYAQQQMYKVCIDNNGYYDSGCEEEILFALRESADCLMGVAITCGWFEVFGILLALLVANNLKNSVQVYKNVVKY